MKVTMLNLDVEDLEREVHLSTRVVVLFLQKNGRDEIIKRHNYHITSITVGDAWGSEYEYDFAVWRPTRDNITVKKVSFKKKSEKAAS